MKLIEENIYDLNNIVYIECRYNKYLENNNIVIVNNNNFFSYITNTNNLKIEKIFKSISNINKNFIKIDNFLINLKFLVSLKPIFRYNTLKLIFKNNIKLNIKFTNDLLMMTYLPKLNNFLVK